MQCDLEVKHGSSVKELEEVCTSLRRRLNELEKCNYENESLRNVDANQHSTFLQELKSKHQLLIGALEGKQKEYKIDNDRLIYKQK